MICSAAMAREEVWLYNYILFLVRVGVGNVFLDWHSGGLIFLALS